MGGTELFAASMADSLADHYGWDVVVLTTSAGRRQEIEKTSQLTIYRLPYWIKLSNTPLSLGWIWRVRSIIRLEQPDLINVHTPVPGIGDIASMAARGRPVVVNYHAGTMRKEKSRLNSIIWIYENILAQPMLRKAKRIVSSSDFVRDSILARFRQKTLTISPGVDSKVFHPARPRVRSPHIIFVGSLDISARHKNLSALLMACQRLKASEPGLTLTVVGDGDDRARYEETAATLGLSDVVTFTGWLGRGPLADTYRAASVFALPSSDDSFPLTITEAMASGLPVVSTLVGGIPTLVESEVDGLLVAAGNTDELTAALHRVLRDGELGDRMGKAGRDKAVTSLDWSTRAQLTDRIFREVMASAGRMNAFAGR